MATLVKTLDEAVYISQSASTLGESMNQTILPLTIIDGKLDGNL